MTQHPLQVNPDVNYDDEIDLMALFLVIWNYRKLIASVVFILLFAVVIITLMKTRTYTSTASIINMVDSSMSTNVQGFDFSTEAKSPKNSILLAILQSDTLTEKVVKKAALLPFLFSEKWDPEKKEWNLKFDEKAPTLKDAVNTMKRRGMVKIKSNDKDPTITLSVTTTDAVMSAKIANTFTNELEEYLKDNSFSSVQKSRVFLEEKLKGSEKQLETLKKRLTDFQIKNSVFDLEQQASASMAAYNELALQLSQKETEMEYILSISSLANPRVQNLQSQINAIKKKMQSIKIQGGNGDKNNFSDQGKNLLPLNRISSLRMQMQKLVHDIEVQQKTHDLLVDSYEKIMIQEAKEKIFVTILDKAQVPLFPDSRKTLIKLFLSVFGGCFLGICIAFIIEFIKNNMDARPDERSRDKKVIPDVFSEPFEAVVQSGNMQSLEELSEKK